MFPAPNKMPIMKVHFTTFFVHLRLQVGNKISSDLSTINDNNLCQCIIVTERHHLSKIHAPCVKHIRGNPPPRNTDTGRSLGDDSTRYQSRPRGPVASALVICHPPMSRAGPAPPLRAEMRWVGRVGALSEWVKGREGNQRHGISLSISIPSALGLRSGPVTRKAGRGVAWRGGERTTQQVADA